MCRGGIVDQLDKGSWIWSREDSWLDVVKVDMQRVYVTKGGCHLGADDALGGPLKGATERRCTYDANGHDNILDLRKIRMYLLTVIIKKKAQQL